jgi:hypothetical protein
VLHMSRQNGIKHRLTQYKSLSKPYKVDHSNLMRCLGMVGRAHWRSMTSCRKQATKPSLRPMHSQDLANGLAFSGLPVVAAYQHLCQPKQAQTERAQRCMLQPMHSTTAGCKIIISITITIKNWGTTWHAAATLQAHQNLKLSLALLLACAELFSIIFRFFAAAFAATISE